MLFATILHFSCTLIFQSQWNIGHKTDRCSRTSVLWQILAVHDSFKALGVAVAVCACFFVFFVFLSLCGWEEISILFHTRVHTHTHTQAPCEESTVFWQACWFISISKNVSSLLVYIKAWISCESFLIFCTFLSDIQLFSVESVSWFCFLLLNLKR